MVLIRREECKACRNQTRKPESSPFVLMAISKSNLTHGPGLKAA